MKKQFLILIVLICATINVVQAQIKVFNGGNVAIGSTLTPALGCRLHLTGNSVFTENNFWIESAAFIKGQNRYSLSGIPDFTWYNNTTAGIFHPANNTVCISTNGNEVIRFAPSGNVLIANPTDYGEKLCVNAGNQTALITYVHHESDWKYGQVSYANRPNSKPLAVIYNVEERFKVYGYGDVWAYGHYTGSDSLLKENILPISDALKKVIMLEGVYYNYIPEQLNNPDDTITIISNDPPITLMGLIAEDVEPIVPEVVRTFEDGLKGISYGNLIALLIEAIKEQQIQIETLQANLNSFTGDQTSNPGNNNNEMNFPEKKVDVIISNEPPHESNLPLLYQNVPNPFNEKTTIQYYLPDKSQESSILLFNMQGTLIKSFILYNKGKSEVEVSGGELVPGMYMYSLISDLKEIDTKKMILTF